MLSPSQGQNKQVQPQNKFSNTEISTIFLAILYFPSKVYMSMFLHCERVLLYVPNKCMGKRNTKPKILEIVLFISWN